MSHGNRNLPLARSRYTMLLRKRDADFLTETKKEDRIISQRWKFNNTTMYDIDPKYQSAVVKLRSLHLLTKKYTAEQNEPAAVLTGHANLDGADDYLEISLPETDTSLLSWTQDWSLAFHLIEVHNPTEGTKRTIATRGNNGIYFSKGVQNWGFYATATDGVHNPASNEGMSHSHGVNTWFVPEDNSKHLFTYKSSTGKLRWYCNGVLKGTIQMTSTEMTKGVAGEDKLNIGDGMSGYYGSQFWDGHIDDLLLMSTNLVDNSPQITEYFSNSNYTDHSEYSDKILSWFKLDPEPDTYPVITDTLNYATGKHMNGNINTAFVTTGETVGAQEEIVTAAVQTGIGTPYVLFKLMESMPNNAESELPQSIGPSNVLRCVPTSVATDFGDFVASSYTFNDTASETGKYVSSTVINNDLRIEIEASTLLDEDDKPIFGIGPETLGGLVDFTAEIDIQLLINAPDTDSMDLG